MAKEKEQMIENLAEKINKLDEVHKAKITGYMEGIYAERAKWMKKMEEKEAV